MTRETISEELEHLDQIALRLGEFKVLSISLPLDRPSVLEWIESLRKYVAEIDQMDLRYIFASSDIISANLDTPDICKANIGHYLEVIDKMRQHLYSLKVSNRNGRRILEKVTVGDYCRFSSGRITFRNQEITFGGKLKEVLAAFLENDSESNTLSAEKIANIWGDDNKTSVPRHIEKLNSHLRPYYSDGKSHIRSTSRRPLVYRIDIT